ncbi:MAG: hypothetical protein ACHBN1_33985 [Heteroscytonema crispum UTEX LB 1556]
MGKGERGKGDKGRRVWGEEEGTSQFCRRHPICVRLHVQSQTRAGFKLLAQVGVWLCLYSPRRWLLWGLFAKIGYF